MTTHLRRLARRLPGALLLALVVPGSALAADPPDVTTGDGAAATVLVILLLGSLTAGLFFASPLRRRFARGSLSSTAIPLRVADSRAGVTVERISAAVHDRLARATRRWPRLNTATPLPPMLGGDIFFDEDDEPGPAPTPLRPATRMTRRVTNTPWSTGPLAADERYLPRR